VSKSPLRSLGIGGLFAVLAALMLGLVAAGTASAATTASTASSVSTAAQSQATPQTVYWKDQAGQAHSARALTATEVKSLGLDKYIDMSKFAVTTPTLTGAPASGSATTAVKRPAGSVAPLASGCWSTWFGYGTFSGLQLWGKTDVTWCGGGTWVTYSTSNCYGYQNYPTYQYLGCSNYPNYGSGWNLYQVKTQWSLCYAWVPIWGSCVAEDYPWEQYQYLGNGNILYNGGS